MLPLSSLQQARLSTHMDVAQLETDRIASDAPLFIFVHGTWAPRAPWTKADSALARRLRKDFPGSSTIAIPWSGANSFKARLECASSIIEAVSNPQNRARPKMLIRHSHGGSAIVYALQQSEDLRASILGAIFLGTPFFAMAPRLGYRELFKAVALIAVIVGLGGLSFVAGYLTNPEDWLQSIQDPILLAVSSLIFAMTVVVSQPIFTRLSWLDRLWRTLSRSSIKLSTANCPRTNLLFLRTTGDEVALCLPACSCLPLSATPQVECSQN
jgi:hypothetical protein